MKALLSNAQCMQLLVLHKRKALGVGKKPAPRATADKMLDLYIDAGFWSGVEIMMKHIGPLLASISVYEVQH
ncbi:hypothetical protein ABBQ32_002692 [Trebouxia sp. C0010 RCD-2024]